MTDTKTEPKAGIVIVTFNDGKQINYEKVTNMTLSHDWAFIKLHFQSPAHSLLMEKLNG